MKKIVKNLPGDPTIEVRNVDFFNFIGIVVASTGEKRILTRKYDYNEDKDVYETNYVFCSKQAVLSNTVGVSIKDREQLKSILLIYSSESFVFDNEREMWEWFVS